GKIMDEFKGIISEIENNINFRQKDREKLASEIKKAVAAVEKTIEKIKNLEAANEIKKELEGKNDALNRLNERKKSIELEIVSINSEIAETKRQMIKPDLIETEGTENRIKLEGLQEKLLKIKADLYEFSDKGYDSEIKMNTDEAEKTRTIVKNLEKEKVELEIRIKTSASDIGQKQKELEKCEKEQARINSEFKVFLDKKQKIQDEIHESETRINETQTRKVMSESEINELKINRARINAEIETFEFESREFTGIEVVKDMSIDEMEKRLRKNEEDFQKLGNVNLRALEVYDRIKTEYDEIAGRVAKLEEEKTEILKIIAEIDSKKKKTFMQTYTSISDSFAQNFRMLDAKGREGFLELENKEDPFGGGMDIVIKLGKGKYMDVDALSGGEKVITALALLFAIQKYKPYSFYVFDEIDPALDKRNSERFAALLQENTKNSQGIIITHNDSVMNHADTLYGATMQEGVSKVVSLKI
ncbi:MAG: AAA family ATPase, partial [Candidatus Paceibacterota bacterium]